MAEQSADHANVQEKLDFWSSFQYAILGITEPKSKSSIGEIAEKLNEWQPDAQKLDSLLALSQRSLTEVTRLTEYEDGKANRILMSMAFLSALAGVLFSKFVDKYHNLLSSDFWTASYFFVLLVYIVFFSYVVLLIAGAIFVLHAVMPRFNIPADWRQKSGAPASFLFFEKMIEVTPTAWAEAFSKRLPDAVKRDYINNSVLESFLIAEKIRIKLGKLQHGLGLLWRSTRLFGLWIVVYGVVIIVLPTFGIDQDVSLHRSDAKSQTEDVIGRLKSLNEQVTAQNSKNEELSRRIEEMKRENAVGLDTLAKNIERLKQESKIRSRSQDVKQRVTK